MCDLCSESRSVKIAFVLRDELFIQGDGKISIREAT